jgi:hypothetical protein
MSKEQGETTFLVGDVVTLNNGGPLLVVTKVVAKYCTSDTKQCEPEKVNLLYLNHEGVISQLTNIDANCVHAPELSTSSMVKKEIVNMLPTVINLAALYYEQGKRENKKDLVTYILENVIGEVLNHWENGHLAHFDPSKGAGE